MRDRKGRESERKLRRERGRKDQRHSVEGKRERERERE
jgi:hypothetical protein